MHGSSLLYIMRVCKNEIKSDGNIAETYVLKIFMKVRVVFSEIPMPGRLFWRWASACTFLASRSISFRKELLYYILNMHLKTKILHSHCAGYFKDGTPENSDLFHCGKAVAFQTSSIIIIIIIQPSTKNNKNCGQKWRKNWAYISLR